MRYSSPLGIHRLVLCIDEKPPFSPVGASLAQWNVAGRGEIAGICDSKFVEAPRAIVKAKQD